eukprot:Skav221526  [mRNA]  locus=scaffold1248:242424:242639:+ [translate_table: standard]
METAEPLRSITEQRFPYHLGSGSILSAKPSDPRDLSRTFSAERQSNADWTKVLIRSSLPPYNAACAYLKAM